MLLLTCPLISQYLNSMNQRLSPCEELSPRELDCEM